MDVDPSRLKAVPTGPGCYLFKDAAGAVIYAGKAKSLRARLRSHFSAEGRRFRRVREAADFEVIVTGSELEALVLEGTLIRELQPKHNRSLKDQQYLYLAVTVQEPFPRLVRTRERRNDGAAYFGPYPSRHALDGAEDVVRRVFPIRACDLVASQTT